MKIIVNQIGEAFRGDQTLSGSINIGELQDRLKRKPTRKDEMREFYRLLREKTSPAEYQYVKRVWALQKLNTGRFRVWGRDGKIMVSTEFLDLAKSPIWKEINNVAKELGAKVFTMMESMNRERSKMQGKPWKNGPNYGKLERQVDLMKVVEQPTMAKVRRYIREAGKATQLIWDRAGVNVV